MAFDHKGELWNVFVIVFKSMCGIIESGNQNDQLSKLTSYHVLGTFDVVKV